MFSPRLLIIRACPSCFVQAKSDMCVSNIYDNKVKFKCNRYNHGTLIAKVAERLRNRLQSDSIPVRIRTLALPIKFIMRGLGGHSGRETPVPIPNTEDKPASVPYCTEVREPLGNLDRCQPTHYNNIFLNNIFMNSIFITTSF